MTLLLLLLPLAPQLTLTHPSHRLQDDPHHWIAGALLAQVLVPPSMFRLRPSFLVTLAWILSFFRLQIPVFMGILTVLSLLSMDSPWTMAIPPRYQTLLIGKVILHHIVPPLRKQAAHNFYTLFLLSLSQ